MALHEPLSRELNGQTFRFQLTASVLRQTVRAQARITAEAMTQLQGPASAVVGLFKELPAGDVRLTAEILMGLAKLSTMVASIDGHIKTEIVFETVWLALRNPPAVPQDEFFDMWNLDEVRTLCEELYKAAGIVAPDAFGPGGNPTPTPMA